MHFIGLMLGTLAVLCGAFGEVAMEILTTVFSALVHFLSWFENQTEDLPIDHHE